MWNNLALEEHTSFKDTLHLLPTKNSIADHNKLHLAKTAQPILQCVVKHNCSSAKKASVDDADCLEPIILLAEGAKVMITRNLWTSKGEYFTLPHLFRSDSGYSDRNFRNFRNPVDFFFFLYVVSPV